MVRVSMPVLAIALVLDLLAFGLAVGAMVKRSKVRTLLTFSFSSALISGCDSEEVVASQRTDL